MGDRRSGRSNGPDGSHMHRAIVGRERATAYGEDHTELVCRDRVQLSCPSVLPERVVKMLGHSWRETPPNEERRLRGTVLVVEVQKVGSEFRRGDRVDFDRYAWIDHPSCRGEGHLINSEVDERWKRAREFYTEPDVPHEDNCPSRTTRQQPGSSLDIDLKLNSVQMIGSATGRSEFGLLCERGHDTQGSRRRSLRIDRRRLGSKCPGGVRGMET